MAKAKALWEGLTEDRPSGTYIRPHGNGLPGYAYGRWVRGWVGHYRFDELGQGPTVEACREALRLADVAADKRAKELGKRHKR